MSLSTASRVKNLILFRGVFAFFPYIADFLRGCLHGYPGVLISRGVTLRNKKNIKIGKLTRIEAFAELDGFGSEGLNIGARCKIGKYTIIRVPPVPYIAGRGIKLSDDTTFAEFCFVGGAALVEIGTGNSFGQYVSIHPQNHIGGDRSSGTNSKGIKIGNDNWFGSKATILDAVYIGNNNVIGAGTVVTKSIDNSETHAGVPNKKL